MGSKELHTAEHIFARALQNLGVDLHVEKVDTESGSIGIAFFREKIDLDTLSRAEMEANKEISSGLTVSEHVFKSIEEAKAEFPAVRLNEERLEGKESLRLIKIGDYDFAMCKHQHVSNTSQIGAFALVNVSYPEGRTKIEFLSGNDALYYLLRIKSAVLGIAHPRNFPSEKISERYASAESEIKRLEKLIENIFAAMVGAGHNVFYAKGVEISSLYSYAKGYVDKNEYAQLALINESQVLCLTGSQNKLSMERLGKALEEGAGFKGGIKEHSLGGRISDPDKANVMIITFFKQEAQQMNP